MTHFCCPDCRLRFSPAVAADLGACPQCGGPAQRMASPEGALGFRLFVLGGIPPSLAEAVAVSIPVDDLS